MLRSHRFALASAAVLIGLSACGDASPRTTAASRPPVIQLSGGSSSAGDAKEAASSRMMMPMQVITFVYDGVAPDLAGEALAWTLPAGAGADTERIARIATLLGVEGEVRELPVDQGGGWMVGAADYTTATLTVSTDGMLSWWFNPTPMSSPDVSCVMPVEELTVPDETVATDVGVVDSAVVSCEAPQPPANVPDESAARVAAESLFTDMGYDAGAFEYDVYADEWGANVTGWLMLDGHRSPIAVSVGFGAYGAITWASGALATPQQASTYPLVGIDAAVLRLNDETGQWMNFPYPATDVAPMDVSTGEGSAVADEVTTAVATEVVADTIATDAVTDTAVTDTAPTDAPATTAPVESLPVECGPASTCDSELPVEMEAITVHLTDARLDLTMVWAQDGTVWLLPAYTFTFADDGQYTVIAVDDSFIALPEPVLIDPMPLEPVPVESTPVEPVTGAEPPAAETSATAVEPQPADATAAEAALVGLTLDEAEKVAAELGWTVRVSTLDGEAQPLRLDLQPNRINLVVADGVVTGIDSVG